MRIASVARALPPHRYSQAEISAALASVWSGRPSVLARLSSLHGNTRVEHRHLSLPIESYLQRKTFGETNDAWIRVSQELGERAVSDALARAGLGPRDVDLILAISVTGIASPSLEARLANRLGFRSDVARLPIFGLGCVGGAAGLSRAADYVKAYPDRVAVLLSVELSSLTFHPEDVSLANVISAGLFGDGAAAVVVVGEERAARMGLEAPRIEATRSVFYPDTEDLMGWRISESGFRIVLSPDVPGHAREHLGRDALAFLRDCGVEHDEVGAWICHPGGPKVLEAIRDALELDDAQVALSWKALAETGNLSSTSVLLVLEETLATPRPAGTPGVLLAMGPAFCSELVLIRW
ncbi:MAG TPA: 3-oxoacyl-[acyl-carrier-protein] synthase III C-terminal domain-containing protein [Planctomycetota bacterium]|nr:3-oxoacyl-[acyl-carrier-protein] synthase III C-terminal domain-containing protein [Planctomycetota bacterium]